MTEVPAGPPLSPVAGAAARGGLATLGAQGARVAVQLGTTIVLARILSPADFGLFALVLVVVNAGELVRDFGLTHAAIQAEYISDEQKSRLYWYGIGIGVAFTMVMLALSPVVARVVSHPEALAISCAMSAIFILNSSQAQHQAQLARSSRFGTLAFTEVLAQLSGMIVAVALAVAGAGVWSLVGQALTASLVQTLLRSALSGWRPYRPRRGGESVREFLLFGRDVSASQAVSFVATNADTVALGLSTSPTALGYYNRGYQFASLPLNQALVPLTNVALPTFARARSDEQNAIRVISRVHLSLNLVVCSAMLSFALLADPLVRLLLGDTWLPTITVFALLAAASSFQALSFVNYWIFLGFARTRSLLRFTLTLRPLGICAIVAAAPLGINAVAATSLCVSVLHWTAGTIWVARAANLSALRLFKPAVIVQLISGGVAGIAWLASALGTNPLLEVAFGAAGAGMGLIVAAAVLPSTREHVLATFRGENP
ncbi:lipopolysaccharide biosynthesis protein [Aeromicrobium sp. 50.2.37]|nr:lipopolysaccharide biosynthesis protein [Aeromicrobium sp. 50.2.37]